ncbi:MAG: hypothetical protein ACPL4C_01040 [Brevinematia bacterium]
MKKYFWILLIIVFVLVIIFLVVSYILNTIELKNIQNTVEKFIVYIQTSNLEELEKVSGGSVFYSLFSGGSVNYGYFQELKNKFIAGSKIEFFKIYSSKDFSQEEKRKVGIFSWKANVLVWNSSVQYAGGYIFYLSRFEEVLPDGNKIERYKVISISNVGEIYF